MGQLGMNYNRCLKHAVVVYRNLLDHIRPDNVILLNNFIFYLKKLANYISSNHVNFLYSLSGGRIWILTIMLTTMMLQFGQQKHQSSGSLLWRCTIVTVWNCSPASNNKFQNLRHVWEFGINKKSMINGIIPIRETSLKRCVIIRGIDVTTS